MKRLMTHKGMRFTPGKLLAFALSVGTLLPWVAAAAGPTWQSILIDSNPATFLASKIMAILGGKSVFDAFFGDVTSALEEGMLQILMGISLLIFKVAGFFLQSMAIIMDISIEATISSNIMDSLAVVDIGWTAVRDFSNMFFIFALLYIAIQTILGLAGGGAKRWIAHLIIAAILINFSLFATKVVIDAGNVLATSFWSKLKVQAGPNVINSASAKFLSGFDLQTLISTKEMRAGGTIKLTTVQQTMVYAGGAVFMFIAGYVFLAAALMMVTRTIMLIMLMIFSPFAFMSFGLPKLEQYGHKWLDKLIKQTFVAPFFIFMLYLNSVLIDKTDILSLSGAKNATFSGALSGADPMSYAIILNFIVLIGFLIASLAIANSFAGDVGGGARNLAKRFTKGVAGVTTAVGVGGALSLGGAAGRSVGGRVGKMTEESATLNKMAESKSGVARLAASTLKQIGYKAKTSSFDVRATKLGAEALSAGGYIDPGKAKGAGGYKATGGVGAFVTRGLYGKVGEDDVKKVKEEAEKLFKGKPEAKEQYLRDKLGGRYEKDPNTGEWGMIRDYDASKDHAETRQAMAREKKEEADFTEAENQLRLATGGKMNADRTVSGGKDFKELGKMTAEEAAQINKNIEKSIEKMAPAEAEAFAKSFGQALEKIGSKKYGEMGQNFLNLEVVQRASTGRQLLEVQTKLADGTLTMRDPEAYNSSLIRNVVRGGTDSGRRVMANQIRQGNANITIDREAEFDHALKDPVDNAGHPIGDKDLAEEIREKNVKNVLSFMTPEDFARMSPQELLRIDPYMNKSQREALGKSKRAALEELVEQQKKAAAPAGGAEETPFPKISPEFRPPTT